MLREMLVYVGIGGNVVALDEGTGTEVWRAELRGGDYVNVLWDGVALVAACDGEVWRLDPRTGAEIWHNELKGLGRGLAGLATTRHPTDPADADAAQRHAEQQRAAAVAAAS